MVKPYKDALRAVKSAYGFDVGAKILGDAKWHIEYVTMNYSSLDRNNIEKYLRSYVEGFTIETQIMAKFGEKVINTFKGVYGNDLTNVLLECVYTLLRIEYPSLKEKISNKKKCRLILDLPNEYVYEVMFGHKEIIRFSKDEQDYIIKYFLYKLENDSFMDYM